MEILPPDNQYAVDSISAVDSMSAADRTGMIGIMVLDQMGLIRSSNRQAASIFGGSPSELRGRPIASLISNIPSSHDSPGFNARSVAHLSESVGWRDFKGVDLQGRGFQIKFDLMRINDGDNHGNSISYIVKLLSDGGRA